MYHCRLRQFTLLDVTVDWESRHGPGRTANVTVRKGTMHYPAFTTSSSPSSHKPPTHIFSQALPFRMPLMVTQLAPKAVSGKKKY